MWHSCALSLRNDNARYGAHAVEPGACRTWVFESETPVRYEQGESEDGFRRF
jgi:hypothetical protein